MMNSIDARTVPWGTPSAVFDKGYQVDKKIHKKSIPVDNSTFPFNKMTT